MIIWMHYAPGERPRCLNAIPSLHQPLPPLNYLASFSHGTPARSEVFMVVTERDVPIDDLINRMHALPYNGAWGRTFTRQDP